MLDPTLLAKYGNLAVKAHGTVEGMLGGMHKSPYKGLSAEFAEHRQYYPGDDIRHIDWRVFGKTDRHVIKEFEEETNLPAWIAVDASGSMAYSGNGPAKYRHASEAAVVLAYLLLGQRDAVGVLVHDSSPRDWVAASSQPSHWLRIAQTLEAREPGGEGSPAAAWTSLADRLRRRGLVILLSDCFAPAAELTSVLRRFRHAGHHVILLHVLAAEEIEFPFRSPAEFRGLEGQNRQRVDPARMRANYLAAFDRHTRELRDQTARMAIDYFELRTDRPLDRSLGEFLTRRGARI